MLKKIFPKITEPQRQAWISCLPGTKTSDLVGLKKSEEEMLDRIIEIDNDDDLYLQYMNEPLTLHNDNFNMDFLVSQMEKIIEGI